MSTEVNNVKHNGPQLLRPCPHRDRGRHQQRPGTVRGVSGAGAPGHARPRAQRGRWHRPDLLAIAEALPEHGVSVLLHQQPWKVAGKKVAVAPPALDIGGHGRWRK